MSEGFERITNQSEGNAESSGLLEVLVEIFGGLRSEIPLSEVLKVLPLASVKRLKKGSFLFYAGDQGGHLGVVLSGLMSVFYPHENGRRKVKRIVLPRELIGPYVSIIGRKPSRYSAVAVENSVVLTLPYSAIAARFDQHHSWDRFFRTKLERQIIEREEREFELFMLSAEGRYLSFLKRYGQVMSKLPKYLIASHIGITPEALSRVEKRISTRSKDEGLKVQALPEKGQIEFLSEAK